MSDVTQILTAIEKGESHAAEELLPVVYEELRRLAAQQLSEEKPGQTLQATALVHEAWLRLVGEQAREWQGSRHFFYAAAQAMRRILVENARRKQRLRHGGQNQPVNLEDIAPASPMKPDQLLALDEALDRLAEEDPEAARLVELRFFAGLGHQSTAEVMGLGRRQAGALWAYARTWLCARFTNNLPETTGVHFHGIEFEDFKMDGVPFVTQLPFAPGETFTYEFIAKPAGSHMYHSHHNATDQVGKGLLGAFIGRAQGREAVLRRAVRRDPGGHLHPQRRAGRVHDQRPRLPGHDPDRRQAGREGPDPVHERGRDDAPVAHPRVPHERRGARRRAIGEGRVPVRHARCAKRSRIRR